MAKILNRDNILSMLMCEALRGNTDIVRTLIARGADVNKVDKKGATALIYACMNGHILTTQTLIELGANVHTAKLDGLTALMYASMRGHVAIIRMLIGYGANVHAVAKNGYTALMIASHHGRAASIEALIAAGAHVDATIQDGVTGLMLATRNSHPAAVVALMAGGANINAATQGGFTALRLASQNRHLGIISLINGGLKRLQDVCQNRDEDITLILKRLILPVELRHYIMSYDCCPLLEDFLPALGILKASVERRRNFAHPYRSFSSSFYPISTISSCPINLNNGDREIKELKEEGESVAMYAESGAYQKMQGAEEEQIQSAIANSLKKLELEHSAHHVSMLDDHDMIFRFGGSSSSSSSSPSNIMPLVLSTNNSSMLATSTTTTVTSTGLSSALVVPIISESVVETSVKKQRREHQCAALSKRGL